LLFTLDHTDYIHINHHASSLLVLLIAKTDCTHKGSSLLGICRSREV